MEFTKTDELTLATVPANAVVTNAPTRRFQPMSSGSIVTEINGRPLLVFSGRFAFYRDLRLGDKGPDVRQLQEGLQSAGYSLSDDGDFGATTLRALERLYAAHGYAVQAKTIPLSEMVVNDRLPGRIVSVPKVGSHPVAGEPLAKLSTGELRVVVHVDGPVAARLEKRMAASVTAGVGSRPVRGTVESIRNGSDGLSVVIVSTTRKLPDRLAGEAAVAQFTLSRVASDALLVPSRAVARDASGQTSVIVRTGSELRQVQVTVIGEQTGVSALSVDHTELSAGDDVLIK
ncbi:peptidoglycan-binding domain-containing protein [Nocardioides sp. WS12]|uniref:peptidoglycan-binding domain-containing protein n=1 Tax=Nocardioides sp. WS12 TaxID=2486272 RepID=UPI0015FE53A7|nr:peptidoglycan-binding domain-containing protein [Nocardioides sp. WS12]